MPEEELLRQMNQIIQTGRTIPPQQLMEITADNGQIITQGTTEIIQGGNGIAYEVTAATAGGATTGVGLMALEVPAAAGAIAAVLGVALGFGMYNLAPEFWTNLSNQLENAGKTVGGKVLAFFGVNTETGFDEETINIVAQAFAAEGIFQQGVIPKTDFSSAVQYRIGSYTGNLAAANFSKMSYDVKNGYYAQIQLGEIQYAITQGGQLTNFTYNCGNYRVSSNRTYFNSEYQVISNQHQPTTPYYLYFNGSQIGSGNFIFTDYELTYDNQTKTASMATIVGNNINSNTDPTGTAALVAQWNPPQQWSNPQDTSIYALAAYLFGTEINNMQPGGIAPATGDITIDYPDYSPWYVPTSPSTLPEIYPVPVPGHGIEQVPGQEGEQVEVPDYIPFVVPALPIPEPSPLPVPVPGPTPAPDPDPSPTPVPEPSPSPQPDPSPGPNPITPEPVNPPSDTPTPENPPTPSPIPPLIVVPGISSISSSSLFSVYNPSMSQLNQLGAFLWSSSIIDQLKKMWQNPLDGIISLKKVYVNPSVGAQQNIKLGYLDTNVPAPIVTSQFASVSCGSVTISEKFYNSTDYSPYTSAHIYLPFIGIVELDIDEVMNSTIYVTYSVDVYTGACLTEICVKRQRDLSSGAILYQFSGDCSQVIPLTAGTANGLFSTITSLGAAAIGIAAGGAGLAGYFGAMSASGVAATANQLGHTLTHEMLHVGRSGSLSANPGIMGQRKPYVILSRRNSYDANSYNTFWGYPANKTVYLSSCEGYTKVKALHLQTFATEEEKKEIERLLYNGVIF